MSLLVSLSFVLKPTVIFELTDSNREKHFQVDFWLTSNLKIPV